MGVEPKYLKRGAKELERLSLCSGLVDRRLNVACYDNCLMVPGPSGDKAALYDCNGDLVVGSPLNRGCQVSTRLRSLMPKRIIETPVFYLGVLYSCWGHCITDEIKFLWPFQRLTQYPKLCNCQFVYTVVDCLGRAIPENYYLLLEELGIARERLMEIKEPTLLRECYFADECMWYDPGEAKRYFAQEYCDLIELVCARNSTPLDRQPTKVYFSRSSWNRWEYGELSIDKAFANAGFEIVKPEDLRFHEMVRMLQNVDVMASSEGSCAHNALFMKKGAKTIYLRKFDYTNRYQLAIDEIKCLQAYYVDPYIPFLYYDNRCKTCGPFFFYPNKRLKELLGVSASFPFKAFFRFVCWSVVLHYGHIVGEKIRMARAVARKIMHCRTVRAIVSTSNRHCNDV